MAEILDNVEAAELGVSPDERIRRQQIMNRRTGQELRDKWAQGDRAEIAAALKQMAPPRVKETRCSVCNSPFLEWVEIQVGKGYGFAHIEKHIPADEDGHKLHRHAIKNHYEKHMPIEEQAIRAVLDEEAMAMAQNAEESARGAVTDRGMLKVLVRKAFEEALSGVTTMEVRDLISAIKLLNDMEVKASETKADEAESSLRIFVRAVQAVCDKETMESIVAEVRHLRGIDDIREEMEGILIAAPIAAIEGSAEDEISSSDGDVTG